METSDHLSNTKFYLREIYSRSAMSTEAQPRLFPVLIDTGCSVACTGFREDFKGKLVPDDFGSIKTANGMATIQGFGLVSWATVTETGLPIIIEVPAYYAPEIPLRLFSPQDYHRYHKMPSDCPTMHGSNAWFAFMHKDSVINPPNSSVKIIMSSIDPDSRLFYFYAETSTTPEEHSEPSPASVVEHSCECHVSQNVHDPKNFNLSSAQKHLLLDHQRLGHFRFAAVRSLYTAPEDTSPPFLDPGPSCHPCLGMKDKAQLICTVPLCQTCQVAKARKHTSNTKKSKPNKETTLSLRVDHLSPGDCLSMDQYESSVRG